MGTSNTLLRWAIPGWTAGISFVLFSVLDYVHSAYNENLLDQIASLSTSQWSIILVGVLVSGAGVPLGFLIFEIYYYIRWHSPASERGWFATVFPGKVVLPGRASDILLVRGDPNDSALYVSNEVLACKSPWRKKEIELLQENPFLLWRYISALVSETISTYDNAAIIHERRRYLNDVLHITGASYIAFMVGVTIYFIGKWLMGHTHWWWIPIAWSVPVACVILATLDESIRRKGDGLGLNILGMRLIHLPELGALLLFSFFVSFNPSIVQGRLIIPLIAVPFVAIVAWLATGTAFALVFMLIPIMAAIVHLSLFTEEMDMIVWKLNWQAMLAVIFVYINSLIILKNRASAKIALSRLERNVLMDLKEKLGL